MTLFWLGRLIRKIVPEMTYNVYTFLSFSKMYIYRPMLEKKRKLNTMYILHLLFFGE